MKVLKMLKIELVTSKEKWDNFLTSKEHANILQSFAWGDFQKALGRKIWRIGIFDENTLVGVALAQKIPTRLRTHIYISNGPEIDKEYFKVSMEKLLGYVKALGIQEKVNFIRFDPVIEDNEENNKFLSSLGVKRASTHTQAEFKWILDISKDEEQLLSEMEKNTRYEIKKAQKEGVVVKSSTEISDFEEFEKLFWETVQRQKFIPHFKEYYRTQFEEMCKTGNYRVFVAKKDNTAISAALIGLYGDTAFYLHAGSKNEKEINKLMGPQIIVWEAIRYAKTLGMKYFDFWGITNSTDTKHPFYGFTRFKKGFGGYQFNTIRGYDLPLSPKYLVISILERYRELWGGVYGSIMKILKK